MDTEPKKFQIPDEDDDTHPEGDDSTESVAKDEGIVGQGQLWKYNAPSKSLEEACKFIGAKITYLQDLAMASKPIVEKSKHLDLKHVTMVLG